MTFGTHACAPSMSRTGIRAAVSTARPAVATGAKHPEAQCREEGHHCGTSLRICFTCVWDQMLLSSAMQQAGNLRTQRSSQ